MSITQLEYWLRGPVPGIPPLLQPVAHALLQARDEIKQALQNFPASLTWQKPAGAASVGFHLQHLTGLLDRMFTYAKGTVLSSAQLQFLSAEGQEIPGIGLEDLINLFSRQVDISLDQLKNIPEQSLLEKRGVGRKQLPSTVMGLLFHAAEHTMRHTGQLLVTIKILTAHEVK